jgi:hypothetical protein
MPLCRRSWRLWSRRERRYCRLSLVVFLKLFRKLRYIYAHATRFRGCALDNAALLCAPCSLSSVCHVASVLWLAHMSACRSTRVPVHIGERALGLSIELGG